MDDMQSLYCRTLSGAIRYNDLCIDYANALIRFFPLPSVGLAANFVDDLYANRDALLDSRESLRRMESLFCALD